MSKRLLITGPRGWTDVNVLAGALTDVREMWPDDLITLVSGHAVGFDRLAEHLAEQHSKWEVERHPVTPEEWETVGKNAGPARNARMVALGADLCVAGAMLCDKPGCRDKAAHRTHGTANCAGLATAAAIPVRWYQPGPVAVDVPPCPRCHLRRGCRPGDCLTIRNRL